jgi:heme/copper-type cytochrome/quinol oxidase subunit 2
MIALPSFALLYAMDDVGEPLLTIKVIGHQWY